MPAIARIGLLLAVALTAGVLGGRAGAEASAARSIPPPLVGIVKGVSGLRRGPLDARTLAPLPGSWSRPADASTSVVRSPRGTAVAATSARTIFVDVRTGRMLRRPVGEGTADMGDLYWVGAEHVAGAGKGTVISVYMDSGSFGYWMAYVDLMTTLDASSDSDPWAVLPQGLVLLEEGSLAIVRRFDAWGGFAGVKRIPLPGFATSAVVADVVHDRLFAVSSDGLVARVDRANSTRPVVSYHRVGLNGRRFSAAWSGQGRIAVWGEDGLGTIDTRTWTTHAIDDEARSALATPYGIVAWTYGRPGVRAYRPDGSLRFTVLADEVVQPFELAGKPVSGWVAPVAVGRYLYIQTRQRMTIDLAAGRVVGRARPDARLAQPSYVPIP